MVETGLESGPILPNWTHKSPVFYFRKLDSPVLIKSQIALPPLTVNFIIRAPQTDLKLGFNWIFSGINLFNIWKVPIKPKFQIRLGSSNYHSCKTGLFKVQFTGIGQTGLLNRTSGFPKVQLIGQLDIQKSSFVQYYL